MASDESNNHYRGAQQFLQIPGAGVAIVSGFLHLLHPTQYALINSASTAAFVKGGWLSVDDEQRRKALSLVREHFAKVANKEEEALGQRVSVHFLNALADDRRSYSLGAMHSGPSWRALLT